MHPFRNGWSLACTLIVSVSLSNFVALRAQATTPRVDQEDDSGTPFALRCLDELGQPIEGAGLIWGLRHELTTKRALDEPLARSGADGWIRCALPTSEHHDAVLVAAPGHASWVQFPWSSPNDRNTQRLAPGVTAKGTVFHESGGKKVPIAGARVELFDVFRADEHAWRTRFSSAGTTDAEGRFAIDGALARGVHMVVEAPGHYRRMLVAVDVSKPIDCNVEPSGYYRGRVIAPPSLSKDWTIEAVGQNFTDWRRYPLQKAGAFDITILDPTPTYLVVRDQGGAIVSRLFDPVRDATRLRERIYVEADVEGAHVLEIRVRDREAARDVVDYYVSTTWQDFMSRTRPGTPSRRHPEQVHEDGRSRVFLLRDHGGMLHIDAPGYDRESVELDTIDRSKELVVYMTPSPVSHTGITEANAKLSEVPHGKTFAGNIRGLPPGVDHRIRIASSERRPQSGHRIELHADGSFRKQLDVKTFPVHVFAELMARPRHGPQRYVKLGTITNEDEAKDYNGEVPASTRLRGKIQFGAFSGQHKRFLVMARPGNNMRAWSWVGPDGSFEMDVDAIRQSVSLHDACTGLQLHTENYDAQGEAATAIEIAPRIAAIDVEIPMVDAFGLHLREREGVRGPSRGNVWMLPDNGLNLPGCASPVRIFVPAGRADVTIVDGWRVLDDGTRQRSGNGNVLRTSTLEVEPGDVRTVKFEK
ncbi:MAG: carboxypeptidase regulatory-like domain-containing protein [Planctomycetes bacterium]|nr:carboxypeptidase regulatory-like domain-containing protein [Planctomycetota bacterium]